MGDDDDDVVWELETPIDEHLLVRVPDQEVWDPDEEDEDLPAPVRPARRRRVKRREGQRGRQPRVLAGLIALVVLVLVAVAVAGRGSDPDADTQDVASAEEPDEDRSGFAPRPTTTRDAASTSTTAVEDTTTTTVAPTDAPTSSIVPAGAIPASVEPAGGPAGEAATTTVPPTTAPAPADGPPAEGTHVSTGVSPERIAAGQAAEVRWRQSSASGITFATFFIQHDATGNHLPSSAACPQGNETARWAGTAHDASFVASCRTPTGAASGRYTVYAHIEHADGSTTRPVIGSIELTGGPADTSPPVLVSSSVSPGSVPAGATVTLTWRFTSPSGMHFSSFLLRLDDQHVTGGPGCATGAEVPMRSGTAHDAGYRATCDTAGLTPGSYAVEAYAQDQAGNVVVVPAGTLIVTAP